MELMGTESASGLKLKNETLFYFMMAIQNGWRRFSRENCEGGPTGSRGQQVGPQWQNISL